MKKETAVIVIDNTNTQKWEMKPYVVDVRNKLIYLKVCPSY